MRSLHSYRYPVEKNWKAYSKRDTNSESHLLGMIRKKVTILFAKEKVWKASKPLPWKRDRKLVSHHFHEKRSEKLMSHFRGKEKESLSATITSWKRSEKLKSYLNGKEKESLSAVLRIRIRDPVPFWPLDPGSRIGFFRIPDLGSRTPRPYF